jgi:hypothetical protein
MKTEEARQHVTDICVQIAHDLQTADRVPAVAKILSEIMTATLGMPGVLDRVRAYNRNELTLEHLVDEVIEAGRKSSGATN